MSDSFISNLHIQKLGHQLEEIRIRALNHIISKLDHGSISNTDFARYLDLLKKLFEWFKFEPQKEEIKVLNLINRILKSNVGVSIVKYCGTDALIQDLKEIRNKTNVRYHNILKDIIDVIEVANESPIFVPPLISDLPLSYRSDQFDYITEQSQSQQTTNSSNEMPEHTSFKNVFFYDNLKDISDRKHNSYNNTINKFGTPSSTIAGFELKSTSASGVQSGQDTGTTYRSRSDSESNFKLDSVIPIRDLLYRSIPFVTLNWQPLVKTDIQVLKSVEESLQKPPQPSILINSCEFFCNVIIQDFPAEVFLQRPSIILLFYDMISTSPSTRITNAALNCLNKLSENLIVRIRHYNDPCTYNLKQGASLVYEPECGAIKTKKTFSYNIDFNNSGGGDADNEDDSLLQCNQIPLPQYCIQTFTCILAYLAEKPQSLREIANKKKTQTGVNTALQLIDTLVTLITICIKPSIWNNQNDSIVHEITNHIVACFQQLGDVLEQYRLIVIASDMQYFERMTQLHLLHSTSYLLSELVPITGVDKILPSSLKNALSSSLLDASFGRLYPSAHETLIQYVNEFKGCQETESFTKFKDVQNVCDGMTNAVKILKYGLSYHTADNFLLILNSLPSFEFHKNLSLINIFLKTCVKNSTVINSNETVLRIISEILVTFLSHADKDIRKETYSLCQKLIVNILGLNHTKHMNEAEPGTQVVFLIQQDVLIEIASHGLISEHVHIQTQAEDMLIHIFKCKILVSESVWKQIIRAIMAAMPFLQCYASYDTPLGKSIVKIMDPDISPSLFISPIDILKGNLRMLFCKDMKLRNEAVSRLCWLVTTEENANLKIPKIKTLEDCGLSYIFQIDYPIDLSRRKSSHQFYQVSSLHQVLEILSASCVDPSIRRSALSQISVMLEDHFLHPAFLEQNGLELILNAFQSSLTENECHNYPDSVIPIISIIKNICLHNSVVRQELSHDIQLIFNILRGLFLYSTDKRMQTDGAVVCCLLCFSEFAIYSYSGRDVIGFSLPDIVVQKLNMPFKCNTHWKTSRHTKPSLTGSLMSDDWCKSTLRMHWNIEWHGGINELINWSSAPIIDLLTLEQLAEFSVDLRITNQDLLALKASSIDYCCQQYLFDIENASTHESVLRAVRGITGYISLWLLANKSGNYISNKSLLELPWNSSFFRFLSAPPSNYEDQSLLVELLRCLISMLKLYKNSGKTCWIADILQDTAHYLPRLLKIDINNEYRLISMELLTLIADCSTLEQHLLDMTMITGSCVELENEIRIKTKNWVHIIQTITENLKFSDTDQFYNLAYLDKLLLCLVQITSNLGWGESQASTSDFQKLFPELIEALTELISAFHYGKGSEAASSFMGLNVTRNSLLTMNHILFEMQQSYKKNWESYWLNDSVCNSTVLSLFSLWCCRDVVVRAATLQLLCGLASSPRGATVIVENVRHKCGGVWETTLMILLDHSEASVVREQAAILLTNLTSHVNISASGQATLPLCHAPLKANKNISSIDTVFLLLQEYNFFDEIEVILSCLHIDSTFEPSLLNISKSKDSNNIPDVTAPGRSYVPTSSSGSKSSENGVNIFVTPSLVKSVANFFNNLLYLSPEKLTEHLAEKGLIRGFFRCLTTPKFSLVDSKEFLLYTDTLQMCSAVCSLLTRSVLINISCRTIVLHTKDCLHVLIYLLNPNLYNINRPHFLYLRNQLWSEIFRFLTALLEINPEKINRENKIDKESVDLSRESYAVISSLFVECGHESFIKSVCEAIESRNSSGLQKSALQSLTSLLTIETLLPVKSIDSNSSTFSMQFLLDSMKSPRIDNIINIENIDPQSEDDDVRDSHSFKFTSLTETYKNAVEGNILSNKDVMSKKVKFSNKSDKSDSKTEINIMIGAELCKILLRVYEFQNMEINKDNKRKGIVIGALSSLLNMSDEAKKCALNDGFLNKVLTHLKNSYMELSLYSAESLRKISEKKKVCPILKEVDSLFCLLTNFIAGNEVTKKSAANSELADVIHKYWVWFCLEYNMLTNILKLLCTFTTNEQASHSLILTNPAPGSGPRKVATSVSLLNAIINLIMKEMELISRSHDTIMLQLSFHILQNVCSVVDCRIIIVKSNLFQSTNRLHPAITKRQKPWETVEQLWLEFLEVFTYYPEGQVHLTKCNEILELLMSLTSSPRPAIKLTALSVLRNVAFHHSNRIKLLSSVEFIQILHNKLITGNVDEKNIIISIIWALAANSQRSKIALKCAGLDSRIQDLIKQYEMQGIDDKSYQTMLYVLGVLKEGEK